MSSLVWPVAHTTGSLIEIDMLTLVIGSMRVNLHSPVKIVGVDAPNGMVAELKLSHVL